MILAMILANSIAFSDPIPFTEALQALEVQSILPTTLTSAELEAINAEILERAFFMARATNAEYVQLAYDTVQEFSEGKIDLATARLRMKDFLREISYEPAPEDAGGLKDLSSDERINLVLRTNADMAAGYGQWMQGQRTLDAAPAQELYRAYHRKVPRNWIARWSDAGGKMFDGRLIALKNDKIWTAISRFGTPYPPFDFNSGMSVRSVDRRTAMDLGLIDLDTQIAPQTREFNEDLQVSPDVRSDALRSVLTDEGYSFTGDVLTL